MRRSWASRIAAISALVVTTAGPLAVVDVHHHPIFERDLVAHEVSEIAGVADAPGFHAAAHLHPATRGHHDSCPACLAACAPSEAGVVVWSSVASPAALGKLDLRSESSPRRAVVVPHSGRAPPSAT